MTGPLGFAPSLRLDGRLDAVVADSIMEQLLAVLREALSNVARHANATQADVAVSIADTGSGRDLVLTVQDNGSGIKPGFAPRSGLANMADRAPRSTAACKPSLRRMAASHWSGASRLHATSNPTRLVVAETRAA